VKIYVAAVEAIRKKKKDKVKLRRCFSEFLEFSALPHGKC
jgi:hypothetical protein